MSIRVVTYNIHSGLGIDGQQNYRRIGEFLAERNVDVALLQEMDTRPAERDSDQDIEDLCAGHFTQLVSSPALSSDHGWYGNAVISRFPISFNQTIDVTHVGRQPRNIQEVIVQTPNGPLHLLNAHKGLKRVERSAQFEKLSSHLKRLELGQAAPLLVGGDFNEWQIFSKLLRNVNRLLTPHPVGATFPTRCPIFGLDRLWSGPGMTVHSARVVKTPETRIYSDHYPIEADISFTAKAA